MRFFTSGSKTALLLFPLKKIFKKNDVEKTCEAPVAHRKILKKWASWRTLGLEARVRGSAAEGGHIHVEKVCDLAGRSLF